MRWLLVTSLLLPVFAQRQETQHYWISIGTESSPVSLGTIWLYSYSWYGLQQLRVARIENGFAAVPLNVEQLKAELNPHPNIEVYLLVLQIGEHLWYRTPNISPQAFWTDILAPLNALGKATSSSGETRLILPAPAKRRITLLYPDGRPAVNADLRVSEYLYDQNHCGAHTGLPLGTLRTDESGTIVVLAPLVPLYLDDLTYFEKVGSGPAGVAYSYDFGLKLGPEDTLTLKKAWELTKDDYRLDDFELRVLTTKGAPRRGVAIDEIYRTNTCGGGGGVGTTDAHGTARIELIAETIYALSLTRPDGQTRDLTDSELRTLFSRHKLTVRW